MFPVGIRSILVVMPVQYAMIGLSADPYDANCRIFGVHLRYIGCAHGHGVALSFPACPETSLGGVPEQILPRRRLQVCSIQLRYSGQGGVVGVAPEHTRLQQGLARARSCQEGHWSLDSPFVICVLQCWVLSISGHCEKT